MPTSSNSLALTQPNSHAAACSRIALSRASRRFLVNFLLSFNPSISAPPKITAPTTRGPAHGPRPTSSTEGELLPLRQCRESCPAPTFFTAKLTNTQPNHTATAPSVFAKISQLVSSSVMRAKPNLTINNSASSLIHPKADTKAKTENAITNQCDRQRIANTRYAQNSPVNSPPPTKCVVKLVSCPSINGDGKYHEMKNSTQARYNNQRYFFSSVKP